MLLLALAGKSMIILVALGCRTPQQQKEQLCLEGGRRRWRKVRSAPSAASTLMSPSAATPAAPPSTSVTTIYSVSLSSDPIHQMNKQEAELQCAKIQAVLPSFKSEEEVVEFSSIACGAFRLPQLCPCEWRESCRQLVPGAAGLELWLGCTDAEAEGSWVCEANDAPFFKWAKGSRGGEEPNGAERENCAVFSAYAGAMGDVNCLRRSIRRSAFCSLFILISLT